MAQSPAHRWGQIIGNLFEASVEARLRDFAEQHSFYLDKRGRRPARDTVDLVWTDLRGNQHKLDYVLERGGTASQIGAPVAFVEVAWRRYTKHSKNKAQEIEAAIQPLLAKYDLIGPFFGAILGGEFTENALQQLRSGRCEVLYFPYDSVVAAFATVGIDASSEEATPDAVMAEKIQRWEELPQEQQNLVTQALLELNDHQVQQFMEALRATVARQVSSVQVLPLHGVPSDFSTLPAALSFLDRYQPTDGSYPLAKYEIEIRFDNGNSITGVFHNTESAIDFLHRFATPGQSASDSEV
ncbi:MAG TPA: hypothetical protein VMV29_22400 [Ktedonobacterales bacterium]|nr:hypothetical protein [Ktedonobacterales bacterium]